MQNIVVFGNCQAGTLSRILWDLPQITGQFNLFYHEFAMNEARKATAGDELAACDILLIQDTREWQHYPFRDQVRSSADIMKFPFYYFGALWPFDSHQNGPDKIALGQRVAKPFGYLDHLLGRLRDKVPDPSERFEVYRKLAVSDVVDINRYAEIEEVRLLTEDKRYRLEVGRFIVENYRHERLFETVTHPAGTLMKRIADELLGKLGVRITWPSEINLNLPSRYQVPIHPHVIEALKLEFVSDETLYHFYEEDLSFEQYVRRYIETYG